MLRTDLEMRRSANVYVIIIEWTLLFFMHQADTSWVGDVEGLEQKEIKKKVVGRTI